MNDPNRRKDIIDHIEAIAAECGHFEPVDYFLWTLQRTFEKREDRYLELLWPQCSLVVDVDDMRTAEYGAY